MYPARQRFVCKVSMLPPDIPVGELAGWDLPAALSAVRKHARQKINSVTAVNVNKSHRMGSYVRCWR